MTSTHFPRIYTLPAFVAIAVCSSSLVLHGQAPGAARESKPGDPNENAEVVLLEEFSVTASVNDTSIKADETVGALRVNTQLVESPITVAVLKPEFLEAFLLTEEQEQASYVAGSNLTTDWGNGYTQPSLRGFPVPYFRNGFRRPLSNSTANTERIEYVKGPMAATFGRTAPGGLVNYVTKRARKRPGFDFLYAIGPDNHIDTRAGITGPLAKNLYGRADVSYRNLTAYQDFFYQRNLFLSSSMTWQLGRNTTLMLDLEYMVSRSNVGHGGLVAYYPNNGTFISPVTGQAVSSAVQGGRVTKYANVNILGPDAIRARGAKTVDMRFEHRFNRAMSLRVNAQAWTRDFWAWAWTVPTYNLQAGTTATNRQPRHEEDKANYLYGMQADLLSQFKTGPVKHRLLTTVDVTENFVDYREWRMPNINVLPTSVLRLSASNPDWTPYDRSQLTSLYQSYATRMRDIGTLVSDRMDLLKGRVLLYGSLRYDNHDTNYENHINQKETADIHSNMFSESLGGVAHIIPGKLLAYVNRSASFEASTTIDRGTGKLQDLITSRGTEAGFRGELIDRDGTGGRRGVYWSLSFFRIDQKNPQRNPSYTEDDEGEILPGNPEYLGNGINRVNGIEFEFFGDFSENISLSISYTKLNAFVKSYANMPDMEGARLLNIPDTSMSATLRHKFRGALKGLSCGASIRYASAYVSRYGAAGSEVTGTDHVTANLLLDYRGEFRETIYNRIEEVRPEVTLYDVFAQYQFKTRGHLHTFGLNIKNITDTIWYSSAGRRNPGRQVFVRYSLKL